MGGSSPEARTCDLDSLYDSITDWPLYSLCEDSKSWSWKETSTELRSCVLGVEHFGSFCRSGKLIFVVLRDAHLFKLPGPIRSENGMELRIGERPFSPHFSNESVDWNCRGECIS
jgi:hypothetical protein